MTLPPRPTYEAPLERRVTPERFWAKVDRSGDGCWLWLGSLKGHGYGLYRETIDGERVGMGAHRVAFTLAKGEIPADLEIDHLCRNRGCVNPAHLQAVPHWVNCKRGGTARDLIRYAPVPAYYDQWVASMIARNGAY